MKIVIEEIFTLKNEPHIERRCSRVYEDHLAEALNYYHVLFEFFKEKVEENEESSYLKYAMYIEGEGFCFEESKE